MNEYSQEAGLLLRRLRRQRNLTLKQVAPQFNRSVAALSRAERGEEQIARSDIQRAIEIFQLTPWDAYQLWMAAGYIPEVRLPLSHQPDLHALVTTLLANLDFPAFILDTIGYVQAWNQGIEMLWAPSQSSPCPHIIGDLFAKRVRVSMGVHWTPNVQQALAVFYHKTLRVATDPAFRRLLAHLTKTHGDEFINLWNGAQLDWRGNGALPVELGETIVRYHSPLGTIEYLVMQSVFQFPSQYKLYLYMPLGAENQARYAQFQARMGEERLYFWDA